MRCRRSLVQAAVRKGIVGSGAGKASQSVQRVVLAKIFVRTGPHVLQRVRFRVGDASEFRQQGPRHGPKSFAGLSATALAVDKLRMCG